MCSRSTSGNRICVGVDRDPARCNGRGTGRRAFVRMGAGTVAALARQCHALAHANQMARQTTLGVACMLHLRKCRLSVRCTTYWEGHLEYLINKLLMIFGRPGLKNYLKSDYKRFLSYFSKSMVVISINYCSSICLDAASINILGFPF